VIIVRVVYVLGRVENVVKTGSPVNETYPMTENRASCNGTHGSIRLVIVIDGIRLHMWARVSIDVRLIGKVLNNDL